MGKYRVVIKCYFGIIEIDDIEADNEEEAFNNACKEAVKEIDNYAKLDEIYEYGGDF